MNNESFIVFRIESRMDMLNRLLCSCSGISTDATVSWGRVHDTVFYAENSTMYLTHTMQNTG